MKPSIRQAPILLLMLTISLPQVGKADNNHTDFDASGDLTLLGPDCTEVDRTHRHVGSTWTTWDTGALGGGIWIDEGWNSCQVNLKAAVFAGGSANVEVQIAFVKDLSFHTCSLGSVTMTSSNPQVYSFSKYCVPTIDTLTTGRAKLQIRTTSEEDSIIV